VDVYFTKSFSQTGHRNAKNNTKETDKKSYKNIPCQKYINCY